MYSFRDIYNFLNDRLELSEWWPHESEFEIFVGAILTQNTTWKNVTYALSALKSNNLIDAQKILDIDLDTLKQYIRPAGFFNSKSIYLKNISQYYLKEHKDIIDKDSLYIRKKLLSIKGVGQETADDILLYVYDKNVFIYDTYARRLLKKFGYEDTKSYLDAKRKFDKNFYKEDFCVEESKRFHGLIVDASKKYKNLDDLFLEKSI